MVDRRVTALVTVVALLGVAGVVAAATLGWAHRPSLWQLSIAVGLAFASWMFQLDLRPGRSSGVLVIWGEAALIVGAVVVGPVWIVPTTALGVLTALVLQRRDPLKVTYNTAVAAIGTALAGCLLVGTGAQLSRPTVTGTLWLLLSVLIFFSTSLVSVSAVVGVAAHRPIGQLVVDEARVQFLVVAGQTVVGVLVVLLYLWQPVLVLAVPVVFWALRRAYTTSYRLRDAEQTSRQMEDVTKRLSSLRVADVLEALVVGAAQLFRASEVQVRLSGRDGSPGPVVVGTAAGLGGTARDLVGGPTVDLVSGPSRIGELVLGFDDAVNLTAVESRTLATLASAGGTALANAQAYEQTAYEATTDVLTGLPNRRALLLAGGDWPRRAEAALMLIDLNRFKDVNDTLGHDAGDRLLAEISRRLATLADLDTMVCRLGGDEFAVLATGRRALDGWQALAGRVTATLAPPATLDGVEISARGAIGVALGPAHGDSVAELLRCADIAMYQAKRAGREIQCYESGHDSRSTMRLSNETALRRTLAEHPEEIVVLYQPQLDLATGIPTGAEAVVRWQHPTQGLLTPAAFLPIVAQSGLTGQLTRLVLDRALSDRRHWLDTTGVDVPVAVNLFPRDLLDSTFSGDVAAALAHHATAPSALVLEIPETVVLSELEAIATVLGDLAGLGVQLSVDDFGTGAVPLSLLARVPVREIKIDQTFVRAMEHSATSSTIVRATIQLAHGLNLRAMAEGVQTLEQEERLREMGCDGVQGFRYDAPLDRHEAAFALRDPGAMLPGAVGADVVSLHRPFRRPR